MLRLDLQFFAHKKGVGSTKNGRDSESKRLGPKRADDLLHKIRSLFAPFLSNSIHNTLKYH